jgi:hypothetical protein
MRGRQGTGGRIRLADKHRQAHAPLDDKTLIFASANAVEAIGAVS